jgi:glutamyl-tRNA synthetase
MSIQIPLTAQPDFALAALAAFQNVEVEWVAATAEPEYAGAKGTDAARAKLDADAGAAGPALPALPSKFDAKTPFVEVSAILDALDDFLAYR